MSALSITKAAVAPATATAAKKRNATNMDIVVREEKAPAAQAFGFTFVLAPSFCLKMGKEDAALFGAIARQAGLAAIVHSECTPTERVVELMRKELGKNPEPDALLGPQDLLGAGAQKLLAEPNAGGASRISEALSMEVLSRAFGATLLQTELEIVYWPASGSITDFKIDLGGTALGVSVTRAMCAPGKDFDEDAATALLTKKLGGVIRSTETCCGAWTKQILHVWAPSAKAGEALDAAYKSLPQLMISDTVVLVTTCELLPCLFEEKASTRLEKVPRALKGAKEAAHLRVLAQSDPMRAQACVMAPVV